MATKMAPVCVLTGDIVRSGALSAETLDSVMAGIETFSGVVAAWPGSPAVREERFRGDGWQLYLGAPRWTLRVALGMRAAIRARHASVETRLAAAFGPVRLGTRLASSSGTAFEASGRALESLGTHRLWRFGGGLGSTALDGLADGLFAVCDRCSQGWTARQAEVFGRLAAPDAPSMIDVAAALEVAPQTVQVHFDRAGGHALLDAVARFEAAVEAAVPDITVAID